MHPPSPAHLPLPTPTSTPPHSGGGNDPHNNVRRFIRYMQANHPGIYERNQVGRPEI